MKDAAKDAVLHALRERKSPLTKDDVVKLHVEHLARYGGERDARQATRVEVQAIMHLQAPSPDPKSVTDEDRIAADVARSSSDAGHTDAAHWKQKRHQRNLWALADALVDAAIGKVKS